MTFNELPEGAKKALVHHIAADCCSESFEGLDVLENMVAGEMSEEDWRKAIDFAADVWADGRFDYREHSRDEIIDFMMKHSPDIAEDYDSFDDYHQRYIKQDTPNHSDNSWAILAAPSCGEAFLDGWHRFHSYIRSGFEVFPVIDLDNSQF